MLLFQPSQPAPTPKANLFPMSHYPDPFLSQHGAQNQTDGVFKVPAQPQLKTTQQVRKWVGKWDQL